MQDYVGIPLEEMIQRFIDEAHGMMDLFRGESVFEETRKRWARMHAGEFTTTTDEAESFFENIMREAQLQAGTFLHVAIPLLLVMAANNRRIAADLRGARSV